MLILVDGFYVRHTNRAECEAELKTTRNKMKQDGYKEDFFDTLTSYDLEGRGMFNVRMICLPQGVDPEKAG